MVERKALYYSRMPANNCRRNNGSRESLFGNYRNSNWFGQESSVNLTPVGDSLLRNRVFALSESISSPPQKKI